MIPDIVHFAFTSDPRLLNHRPFSFVHYLAVRSAARYAHPKQIFVHYLHEPSGPWWEAARPFVTARRHPVNTELFPVVFVHPAHQADAIRLETLWREGGIFLDLDVITLRTFGPLREDREAVIGAEDDLALCCAVLLAEPGSRFIEEWVRGYNPATSDWSGFRSRGFDAYWGEMSTRYPAHLKQRLPDAVEVLPPTAFYPVSWRDHDYDRVFQSAAEGGLTLSDLVDAYTLHLWQTGSWGRHLSALEPSWVETADTTLARHLRPLLPG